MKHKDLIIALSFANIIFYKYWSVIIYFNPSNSYYFKNFPSAKTYLAFIISELIAGLVVWLGIKLLRYLNNKFILKASKVIFSLVVLNFFYELIWNHAEKLEVYGDIYHYLPTTLFVFFIIYLLIKRKFIKTAAGASILIAPFVLVIFGQAIWMMTNADFKNTSETIANPLVIKQDKALPRAVWLLFDEMDQRFAFDDRPKYVKLPEFDRFKNQAFYATNVTQTGDKTGKAIPSLFTGKIVQKTDTVNSSEMMITYKDASKAVKWSQEPDIFSEARKLGLKTALSGDGHPYSRILGHKIDYCQWYDDDWIPDPSASLWYNIYNQLAFLSPFDEGRRGSQIHSEIFNDAQNLVVNPDYQLVFIHFLIPHAPRINEKWGLINATQWGYFGNLELADQTFGSLRKSMEEQGLWEDTTILITSDHQWRKSDRIDGKKDPRVPFILKIAGEKNGTVYQSPFNAVLTKEVLLAILKKQIKTNYDLTEWLNEHRN